MSDWHVAPRGTMDKGVTLGGFGARVIHEATCADWGHTADFILDQDEERLEWTGRCPGCGRRYRLRLEVEDA